MYSNKRSPYRYLVVGSDTKVPLYNGQLTPCINFDNAATTPPLASVMNAIVNFLLGIPPFTEALDINLNYLLKFMKILEKQLASLLELI